MYSGSPGSADVIRRVLSLPIWYMSPIIVNGVLPPFILTIGCTAYTYQGAPVDGVTRSQERYDAKIVYEDTELEQVGDISAQVETVAAFSAAATQLMGDAALAAIIGGTAVRDAAKDTFYCKLKCHDPSGEVYYVTFSRDKVRVSSYESDDIVAAVETWADTITELA